MTAIIVTSPLSEELGILFYPGKWSPIEADLQTISYHFHCVIL